MLTLPAAAHHSGAMFDDKKSVTLSGTVKEFQWTNPHCWIEMLVPAANGKAVEWSVEMGAPFEVIRTGLRPGTIKAGDKITVVTDARWQPRRLVRVRDRPRWQTAQHHGEVNHHARTKAVAGCDRGSRLFRIRAC
jgi:hypothetical protein